MAIRGVLFDVDGTLSAYDESEQIGLHRHLLAEGLLDRFASPADAFRIWRTIMHEEYARFLRGELTMTGQQHARTRRFLASAAVDELTDEAVAQWFARYAVHRDAAWRAFDDAQPALHAMASWYRLGVVSNSAAAHQRAKLRAIGLLTYFIEPLVCSQEHGAAKPTASIFLAGCEVLGLPPDEVAYVGDHYEVDAVGARDAGLLAIWLDRSGAGTSSTAIDGIRVIASLAELSRSL